MRRAIKEALPAKMVPFQEISWVWKVNWANTGGYPLTPTNKAFYPISERELRQEGKPDIANHDRFVEWESKENWHRFTQAGPLQSRDPDGRKMVRIFFQPQSTHRCRSFPFSNCWPCWRTECKECYYMYGCGADRWGPEACSTCSGWTAFEAGESNYLFRVRFGTNVRNDWGKETAIK